MAHEAFRDKGHAFRGEANGKKRAACEAEFARLRNPFGVALFFSLFFFPLSKPSDNSLLASAVAKKETTHSSFSRPSLLRLLPLSRRTFSFFEPSFFA